MQYEHTIKPPPYPIEVTIVCTLYVHVTEPVSGFYYCWLSNFLPLSLVSISGPLKALRLSEITGAGGIISQTYKMSPLHIGHLNLIFKSSLIP